NYSRNCSLTTLVERLARAGCKRTSNTVQRWLADDLIIAPRSEADVKAILETTRDVQLRAELSSCIDAVKTLRGLHLRVAVALGKRVIERAKEWLESGAAADELVQLEDQLVIATVESLDPTPLLVPRVIANRLQEPRTPQNLTSNR